MTQPTHEELNNDQEKDRDNIIGNVGLDEDYVSKSIGAVGLYQCIVITIVSLTRFVAQWNTLSMMFVTPYTEFSCGKFDDNVTEIKNNTCYENCLEYEYNRNVFDENIITEFELICDKAWLASFLQTVLMFGLLCGVSVFGWLSDRYGRSKALKLAGVLNIIFMLTAPLLPTYWSLAVCRFCIGLGSGGFNSLSTVYPSEIIGSRNIELATGLTLLPDGISILSLPLFAHFASSWRWFMIEYSAVSVILVGLVFFVPETPRWLIATGKREEAVMMMTKAAKVNKLDTTGIAENVAKNIESLKLEENEAETFTYLDLFRTTDLAFKTVCSFTMLFIAGFSYYGLNQYLSQLETDLSQGVVILGLIEIPCDPISSLTAKVFGRKKPIIVFFVISGICMLTLILIPDGTLASTVVGGLGMFTANTAYSLIFLLVIELYPTRIRNMGFSFGGVGALVGAMIAPFIANLKPRWLASSIFGSLLFVAAFICFFMPETKGIKLQDTVRKNRKMVSNKTEAKDDTQISNTPNKIK